MKSCKNCKWHDSYSWVCSNGQSDYRADFTDIDNICLYWESVKSDIIEKLEDNLEDMSAHSYNNYTDDSERIITLTVKELRWLYGELTNFGML